MKLAEKIKAQKVLRNIQTGDFDENDLEMLLMRLRPYAKSNHVFREAADFVAHNDERYKGLINASLDCIAMNMRYFQEYCMDGKARLNLIEDFPEYIGKLLLYQVDKYPKEKLRQQLSLSHHQAREIIKEIVRKGSKPGFSVVRPGLKLRKYELVKELLSIIVVNPVFTKDQLLTEIKTVVVENDLQLDEVKFNNQIEKILVLFSLLVHQVPFKLSSGMKAICCLSASSGELGTNLTIQGSCDLGNGLVGVACTVFDTGIPAVQVVGTKLLVRKEAAPGIIINSFELDKPLHFVDGLLEPIVA